MSYALCALIVPVLDGWGGFRAVYAAHGALLALLWPVLLWAVPRIMAAGVPMPPVLELHRQIYTTPRYLAPAVGHGIYASLFIALVAYLPGALGAMWLTPLLPVANLVGTFASGFIARKLAASRLSPLGFGASAVLFLAMGLTGSPMLALAAFVTTGITAGANFAAVPELNPDPQEQARANGAMAQLGNIGTFCGTPVFALVAGSVWGVTGLSLLVCGLGVLCAGALYQLARKSG